MKILKNGNVMCSYDDVDAFAGRWPCFGDVHPIWFGFDSSGDLVDMGDDEGMDPAGVRALSEDAYQFLKDNS